MVGPVRGVGHARACQRIDASLQEQRADIGILVVPLPFVGRTHIRGDPLRFADPVVVADAAEHIRAERLVTAALKIKTLIIPGISRDTQRVAGKAVGQHGLCRGCRHNTRSHIRITPREGRGKRVGDSGRIVDGAAHTQFVASDGESGGVRTNIDLIEMEGVVDVGIGRLHEATSVVAHPAGQKYADLIEHQIVVRPIMLRHRTGGQTAGRVVERAQHHRRQWDFRGQPVTTLQRVAADLEGPAKRRELRPKCADMACRARLASLGCETRHSLRGVRAEQQSQYSNTGKKNREVQFSHHGSAPAFETH